MSIRDPYLYFLFQEQEKDDKQDSTSPPPQEETDPFVGDDGQEEDELDPFVGNQPGGENLESKSTGVSTSEPSETVTQPATRPENSEGNQAVTTTPSTADSPASGSKGTEFPFNPLFLLGLIPLALIGYFILRRGKKRRAKMPKRFVKKPFKRYREKVTPENLRGLVSGQPSQSPDPDPVAAVISGGMNGSKSSFRTEDDPEWAEKTEPVLASRDMNDGDAGVSEDDLDDMEEESFEYESGDFELGQPTSEVKSDAIVDAIENNDDALESGSLSELDFDDESVIESIEANLSNEQLLDSLVDSSRQPAEAMGVHSDDEFDMGDVDFDADIDLEELEQVNEEFADQGLEGEDVFKASAPSFANPPTDQSEPVTDNEGHDPRLQLSDDEFGSFDDFDSEIAAQDEDDEAFTGMTLDGDKQADAESAEDLFDNGDYEDMDKSKDEEDQASHQYTPNYMEDSSSLLEDGRSTDGNPSIPVAPAAAAVSAFSAGQSVSSNEDSSTSVTADAEQTLQELVALQKERNALLAEKVELHRQLEVAQAQVETLTVNDKLPEMEAELESLRHRLADYQTEKTALQAQVSELDIRTRENEKLNEEVESLNNRLQVVREQLEEAKNEVPEQARMEWELSTADMKRQLEEQAKSFESAQSELHDTQRQLNEIDRAAADTDIKDHHKMALIKAKLDQRKEKITKLQRKLRQKIDLVSQLQAKNAKAKVAAEEARMQADEVEHQLFDLRQKHKDTHEQEALLAKQLSEMESRAVAAEEQVSELKANLEAAESKILASNDLEHELDLLKQELVKSTKKASELEKNVDSIEKAKQHALSQTDALQSQLNDLKQQLVSANEHTTAADNGSREEMESLKQQLADYQADEARLKEELNHRSMEIRQVSQRMNVASTQSNTLRDQLAATQQKLQEIQSAAAADRARVAELEAENRAAQFQADAAQQQLNQWKSAARLANEQKAQLDAQQIQITKLIDALDSAGQLSKLQTEYSETKQQLEKEKAKSKKRKASSSKGQASKSSSTNTADQDDLTQIVGIGSILQTRLKKAGVTSFEQIAAWTTNDVQRMSDELNLKNRVEREKWVSQAKKLVRQKR